MGVEHRGEGAVESGVDGGLEALARLEFLADTLKDQDVGVHGHTDTQRDTGDTRQRQHRQGDRTACPGITGKHPEDGGHDNHAQRQQHDVQNQRGVGQQPVQQVVGQHQEDNDHAAIQGGILPALDGILAERGIHDAGFNNIHGSRQ